MNQTDLFRDIRLFLRKSIIQLVPNFSKFPSKSAVEHSAQPDDSLDLAIRDPSDPS